MRANRTSGGVGGCRGAIPGIRPDRPGHAQRRGVGDHRLSAHGLQAEDADRQPAQMGGIPLLGGVVGIPGARERVR